MTTNKDIAMKDLHLNLRGEYFDQIKAGTKTFEYRPLSKWLKRLEGKTFRNVILKRGYPSAADASRIVTRPWRGYEVQTITHPHFGPDPVQVAAIIVN